MQISSYRDILAEELERRKLLNSSYSLRAYARDLDISAPRLSQIMAKKHGLSPKAAQEIADKLKLPEEQKKWFCHSVGALHARGEKSKEEFKQRVQQYKKGAEVFTEIHMEYFKVMAQWYHFAILELTHLEQFRLDYSWMAETLSIDVEEVKSAVERMKNLELLHEEDGKLIDVFKFLATPSDVPSPDLKTFHMNMMKRAMAALYDQDIHSREIASNIFAINKEDVPELKQKLRSFRRELEHTVSKAKKKDAVYCLGMQFFELTRR
ncbi:MAG TPA: DUF4423 domain-containing protein [Bacteriovoracaceae bacterium]|nr:DUF4423 domain-containing protein [Bacteriovoracaceae bacterium]